MKNKSKKMVREKKTVEVMIRLYCNDNHNSGKKLCLDCRELLKYAGERLDKCPFQDEKPSCSKCEIHCYKPSMKEQIIEVMRYSGPRMLYRHPVKSLLHYLNI